MFSSLFYLTDNNSSTESRVRRKRGYFRLKDASKSIKSAHIFNPNNCGGERILFESSLRLIFSKGTGSDPKYPNETSLIIGNDRKLDVAKELASLQVSGNQHNTVESNE